MAKFDAKSFNEKAFGKYMSAIPNVKLNKLRESRAIVGDARLRDTFVNNSQTGTVYAVLPFFGLLSGTPQNYDGVDNVTPGKDSLDVTEEDLKYLRDIAEQEAINRFTTAEINVDMSGMQNTVNSGDDIDGFMTKLTDSVNEAVDNMTEGVHE